MTRSPRREGPRFESDLRRRGTARRTARERVLVVCGAKATEADYLNGLVRHLSNPAVTVRVKTKPGSPSQLVAHASDLWNQDRDGFDQVWCVTDVDEYTDLDQALAAAHRAGIGLAVSNPCFELWLLLHFRDHTAYCPNYRALRAALAKHLPRYDKARLDFRDFASGWQAAVPRARQLAPEDKEHGVNPATGVWRLVEQITRQP
ncbi:RloB family protein [Streptomyces sp. MS19]|uniref:RloB family protein n=1 Tax=Streptomyces sp. MS19 TaxID=3385972 RepID=UPI0039A16535